VWVNDLMTKLIFVRLFSFNKKSREEVLILALDIGNTNIEIGILSQTKGDLKVIESFRFFTRIEITSDEFGIFILNFLKIKEVDHQKISGLIFSSVVPPINRIIIEMFERFFPKKKIIEVNQDTKFSIINDYKNPKEVGSDRLVNADAVFNLYKKNSIIVDMGTATTICALSENGIYHGGAIMPGIFLSTQSLTSRASRLPSINIQKKENLLTNDTASAIESGVYFSNYFALEGMMKKMANEISFQNYLKIATGGFSRIFKDTTLFDVIDYDLSLKGLKIIWDLNN